MYVYYESRIIPLLSAKRVVLILYFDVRRLKSNDLTATVQLTCTYRRSLKTVTQIFTKEI